MMTMDDQQMVKAQLVFDGGGERLLSIQRAILLGIEEIGSNKELAGSDEYRHAIFELSFLLRALQLDKSQMSKALGGKPYAE